MHRRGFLRALLGAVAASPAVALILRPPQTVQVFAPQVAPPPPQAPKFKQRSLDPQFIHWEFTRLFVNYMPVDLLSDTYPDVFEARGPWCGNEQSADISLRYATEDLVRMDLDEYSQAYLVPIVESLHGFLDRERQRGAKGMRMGLLSSTLDRSAESYVCHSKEHRVASRMLKAYDPSIDEMILCFQIRYRWDRYPIIKKWPYGTTKQLRFDPLRLPA